MPSLNRTPGTAGLLLLAVVAAIFLFREPLTGALLERAVPAIVAHANTKGFELRRVVIPPPRFDGLATVRFDRPSVEVHNSSSSPPQAFALSAGTISVSVARWLEPELRIAITGGAVQRIDTPEAPSRGQRVSRIQGHLLLPVPRWSARETMALIRKEAQRIATDGRTTLSARGSAVATVLLGGAPRDLRILAEPEPGRGGVEDAVAGHRDVHAAGSDGEGRTTGGTRIVLSREDLAGLALSLGLPPLTPAEIDLIATNPARAPTLLRLTERATLAARQMQAADSSAPHDAYKHVLWSYLLTREFGAEFARRVTDAHEDESTYELGEAARRMDLQNNAVGRAYAAAGVAESEIAVRVRTDPAVMRR